MSGTGKHGERHFYYACKNHRKHKYRKRNVRKELIESQVLSLLRGILSDDGNHASLAVDASTYYRNHYVDTHYLDGLREELSSTTKSLDNLIRAIKQGLPFSDSIARRLSENKERKKALLEAIEAEETRARVAKDESSIKAAALKRSSRNTPTPTSTTRKRVTRY